MGESAEAERKPVVVLAVPVERSVMLPFFQSYVQAMQDPLLEVRPFLVGNTVIHLARDQMVKYVRNTPGVDYLVMVDSDQTFVPAVPRRLVRWGVAVVAPVIVQRAGEPIPVAYRALAEDPNGFWRYCPLMPEIAAYLRCFDLSRFDGASGSAILPVVRDRDDPLMPGMDEATAAALAHPLLACDAVGTGMVAFRRDVLEAVEPDPKTGLFFDFVHGGEDFAFLRRVRAAGYGGCEPAWRSERDPADAVFVDRGCVVGHVTHYARGAMDLLEYVAGLGEELRRKDEEEAKLPEARELAEELKREWEASEAARARRLAAHEDGGWRAAEDAGGRLADLAATVAAG